MERGSGLDKRQTRVAEALKDRSPKLATLRGSVDRT